MKCPRPNCGGEILKEYDRNVCHLCAHHFDDQGREMLPVLSIGKPMYPWSKAVPRPERFKSKVLYRRNW